MTPRNSPHIDLPFAFCVAAICFFCFVSLACTTLTSTDSASTAVAENPAAININTASASELESVPHIGAALAAKIVKHRELYGSFRKPEHLMLIDGISDMRFRTIKAHIKVE